MSPQKQRNVETGHLPGNIAVMGILLDAGLCA